MPPPVPAVNADLSRIAESAWAEANARFAAIEPLLGHRHSRAAVEQQAIAADLDVSTLYRWLKKYRKSRLVADLLPGTRGVQEGDKRLDPDPERIIGEVIQKSYLRKQKPSIQKVCDEIAVRCPAGRNRGSACEHNSPPHCAPPGPAQDEGAGRLAKSRGRLWAESGPVSSASSSLRGRAD